MPIIPVLWWPEVVISRIHIPTDDELRAGAFERPEAVPFDGAKPCQVIIDDPLAGFIPDPVKHPTLFERLALDSED